MAAASRVVSRQMLEDVLGALGIVLDRCVADGDAVVLIGHWRPDEEVDRAPVAMVEHVATLDLSDPAQLRQLEAGVIPGLTTR